jgi:hypothetical protein
MEYIFFISFINISIVKFILIIRVIIPLSSYFKFQFLIPFHYLMIFVLYIIVLILLFINLLLYIRMKKNGIYKECFIENYPRSMTIIVLNSIIFLTSTITFLISLGFISGLLIFWIFSITILTKSVKNEDLFST